jgi:hypothetical protein
MTLIKSARKIIKTDIEVSITRIKFDSQKMQNKIEWEVTKNPSSEKIISFDLVLFENDTSSQDGKIKKTIEFSPSVFSYVHKNLEIVSNVNYFKTYSYQIIAYTDVSSKASEIEKFDPREIYEIEPPKQITFSMRNGAIYFDISCNKSKFTTNIFVFKKHFDDDVFERIAVLKYGDQLYVDKNISLGHFYEYRFISYDLFGHFSQNIIKIDVFVWNKNYAKSKTNTLFDPIPFAQFAKESSREKYTKLKISNIDPRCLWYRIERKDISEKRTKFEEVEQWQSGSLIKNNGKQEIEFLDPIVRDDMFYQYSVYGIDKFSNRTDERQSNIVYCGLLSSEMPATPINIDGEILNEYPTGVKIVWSDDNLNQKLSDVVSGSSELFPKSNLYYFKVFRRKYDELNYQSFPEQSESFFIDMCSNDGVVLDSEYPYYQPTPPMRDTKYYYYVSTYDAETNQISNKSAELLIDLTVPPNPVTDVEAYFNDVFEPMKCVITWKIDENEKTLDTFIIDRIDENKIWTRVGKSYFNTQFIDTTIQRNNKYIYRIQAADFNGNTGKYSFIAVCT